MNKLAAVNIGDKFFGGPHFLRDLTGVGQLVSILLNNAIIIAGIIFVFLIILAGINFISGGGSPEKIEQSQKIITYAFFGFIIVVGAFLVIRAMEKILGLNILG